MYVEHEDVMVLEEKYNSTTFFQRAVLKRIFLCLKVCTTVKSYTVLFFHLLMHISNTRAIILLEIRLH